MLLIGAGAYCGDKLRLVVRTSRSAMPSSFRAAKTAAMVRLLAARASRAVLAEEATPALMFTVSGAALTVPVAADQVAEVSVEVTLLPKRKGKQPKVYEAGATYEACSA